MASSRPTSSWIPSRSQNRKRPVRLVAELEAHYNEQIVYLPDCDQPSDAAHARPAGGYRV